MQQNKRMAADAFAVVATYPEITSFTPHPAWPNKIKIPFVELQDDVARGRTPAFIISGCRSILDVATKDLKGVGKNIFDRVESLKKQGLLTGALGDWAHALRRLGADATHDLDGEQEDARQFVEFLKLFLHVAYELPQLIKDQWPEAPAPEDPPGNQAVDATFPPEN